MQEIEPTVLYHLSYESSARGSHIPWRSFLEGSLRDRAQEAALYVAGRMGDPEYVKAMAEVAIKQSTYPSHWLSTDLGAGDVGLALMHTYMDACLPGQGFDALADRYLRVAAEGTHQATLTFPGLFGGTAGLAFTLMLASRGGIRYRKTLTGLHESLCTQVLAVPWRRPETEGGVSSSDFDVIVGAAGVLAYLVSIEPPDQMIQRAVAHLLTYLLWLGEPGQPAGRERWYIPPHLLPNELHREAFPRGNFNCGLAHGIAGPLAALSLAWLAGYRTPGLRETIAFLANWVVEHRVTREWGIDWPDSIPPESAVAAHEWRRLPVTRAAWCYGAPGVARSLWLAGCALEDEELRTWGIEAIESTLRRPISLRGIPSPILCHGNAGLLQICLRFAHESESEVVQAQIPALVEQILDAFDPSSPFGFHNTDQGDPIDQPGWLGGAAGVAMALLAATTDVIPAWDRILAIA